MGRLSYARFMYLRVCLAVGFFSLLSSCAQNPPSVSQVRQDDRKTVDQELSSEMSLKADRQELSDLRNQIPAEKQKSNDELALYLQLMHQGTEQPQVVHDKFSALVERHRTSFREKVQKLRENYRRGEAKRRDAFLDGQKNARASYTSSKRTPEQMQEFFASQDSERKNFFADERDRRTSFESEISVQSKDFASYMREKVNEFNEQYRLYSKKFSERPVDKKAVTGEGNEPKKIDQVPSTPLGTGD